MHTILLIEDDLALADLIVEYLSSYHYEIHHAATGKAGLTLLKKQPQLVLLDLMLPDMDGMSICQQIRNHSQIPVIILTAKGDTTDRVLGLEIGADDYVAKPFEPRELLARIRAVLRRYTSPINATDTHNMATQTLTFGKLMLDPNSRQAYVADNAISLTTYQFSLLWFFATHAGQVLTREQLLTALPHDAMQEGFDRAIDVHVSRLRNLIEADPKQPKRIITVRGVGYQFTQQQN